MYLFIYLFIIKGSLEELPWYEKWSRSCERALRVRLCVCVSTSVSKRSAGGQEPMTVCPGQRRPDSIGVKTYLLTISDNFQLCSTHRLRLFQVHRSFGNNTCFRPIALLFVFTSAARLNIALTGFIWILVSIRQVCARRWISVSHSMARLPVWSSRVEAVVWLRRCVFLTLFLSCSCFVFFLPSSVMLKKEPWFALRVPLFYSALHE